MSLFPTVGSSTASTSPTSAPRQATQMLASALGTGGDSGGLNPLYQIGGPRSAQLSLKLMF